MWPFNHLFKVKVIPRSSTRLRLSDWCGTQELVNEGIKLHQNPSFQMALDVLKNEHPSNFIVADDAMPHVRMAFQGRSEGYTLALANLDKLAKFQQFQQPPEPDFNPSNFK